MSFLVSILVLAILIFVHELGHFLFAKFNGVGVVEFSIGFGKKLFKKKIGETTYSIGMIPLGGYVRMIGDDPRMLHAENSKEILAEMTAEERVLLQDRSKWFLNKSWFSKMQIVLAGPGFNLLFAYFAAVFALYVYGASTPIDLPVIGATIPKHPAAEAGILAGDKVLSIDGKHLNTWQELAETIKTSGGKPLNFLIERQDEEKTVNTLTIKVTPQSDSPEMKLLDSSNEENSVVVGIVPDSENVAVSLGESCLMAVSQIYYISKITVLGFWGMVKGSISPKNIAGPIFILSEVAQSAKRGFEALLDFMIFLSVSLAILNLLPIPVLDGGHIVFFTIEALLGAPVSLKIQNYATQAGMVILLLLMLFAVGNDILRFVG
ncbi:MAG: RIP metalloprotease RseP [Bdellovibrionales bacterium]|nr:RIP metalloprotease RseP [Bdellovibrionales bacterium]